MATKRNNMQFSYDVVCPSIWNNNEFNWFVYEKGSKKSDERYEISLEKIGMALVQIREHIWKTACNETEYFKDLGFTIYVKDEIHQFSESVKARGVIYTLLQLSDEQKRKGVITTSIGSFAYSLCYFGKKLDIPVTVVMPISATDTYIWKCQNRAHSRTKVIVQGTDLIETHNIAIQIAQAEGLTYIDGNNHPNMIVGQATLGVEMFEHFKNIDAVILPTMMNRCQITTSIALTIKKIDPKIKVFEACSANSDTTGENLTALTTSPSELHENSVVQYEWLKDFGDTPYLFEDPIIVTDTVLENAARFLMIELNIKTKDDLDWNVVIGLGAILTGRLDNLEKKRLMILSFGKLDSSNNEVIIDIVPNIIADNS